MIDLAAEWRDHAACLGMDSDLFFAEGTPSRSLVDICERCSVRADCLQDALDHGEAGWRGGTSERQRRLMGAKPPVVIEYPTTHAHGTNSGFQAHVNRGTVPCGPCADARAEYQRQYRHLRVVS